MTYQAGHRDFQVATGADNLFGVRFHRRGPTVAAATIVAGDWIVYGTGIDPVYSVIPVGDDKVHFKLGFGTYSDPEVILYETDTVTRADAAVWEAIDMQVALPDTIYSPAPATLAVPTSLDDGDTVCVINIGQTWLEPFQAQIDYADGGPSGMSLPYDLVGSFDGQRIRVLTGTISIIRSAASPAVDPPIPPEVTP